MANPEIANHWVIMLVAAGALAAAFIYCCRFTISDFSLYLMIIKKMINPNISEKMNFGCSISCCSAVIIAGYFGINPPGFVAAVVALALD
jgi:cation/acetate symporter